MCSSRHMSPVTKAYIKVVRVVFLSSNLKNICHSIPNFLLRKVANVIFSEILILRKVTVENL